MTFVLKRATEQTQSEWRSVDEGVWRWRNAKPEVKLNEKYGKYQVRFMLTLTKPEQDRLIAEHEDEIRASGAQQSFRTYYTVGLSLGWMKDNKYESTKLVDFLAACLGPGQTKKFREWISNGGGPPRPADRNDDKAEIQAIEDWLGWWEDLEVYGTVTHREGDGGRVFANFAGPLPVGTLPGQKDPDYDALGRGKLRAIIAESGEVREQKNPREDSVPATRYTQEGEKISGDGSDELPWG